MAPCELGLTVLSAVASRSSVLQSFLLGLGSLDFSGDAEDGCGRVWACRMRERREVRGNNPGSELTR